ncbi:MAG: hypothetical protein KH135_00435 [Firmicutes bacterium]|nr:hypothetical protein [Bacillota bacterium]
MKKLDNRGWGIKDMWIYLGLITFILIVIGILVNQFEAMTNLNTKSNGTHQKLNVGDHIEKGTVKEIEPEVSESKTKETSGKDMNEYYELENRLVIPARTYISKNYQVADNAIIYVSLKKLQLDNLIGDITTKSNEICAGYVMYTSTNEKYQPYLSCGAEYISTGYDKNYE